MSRKSQRRYFTRHLLAHDPAKIYLYREVQRLHIAGRSHAKIAAELYIRREVVKNILQNLRRDPEIQRIIA